MREESRQEQMLAELDGALGRAQTAIVELQNRVDRLRSQLTQERSEPNAWSAAVVIPALLAVVTIVVLISRRRRSLVRVPDTPAELLERVSADR
jgi:uncharacterized coiled-coil protein SlyX